ncbi:hypothetical protein [Kitasatospora sp. NPDC001175]|uniref:hypothetical protein n=1 Tax=Kitasatospora sp. NPDC001175 TaxID=3157103 RepID=UPI003D00BB17
MSKLHVRYVRKAIEDRFTDFIDMKDKAKVAEKDYVQAFLSRGLAALAVQIEHPCSDRAAAIRILDGDDDRGLDAIAVEVRSAQPRICLVQAKWSDNLKGAFGETEVDRMFRGLNRMLDLQYSKFNSRFQQFVPEIEKAFEVGTPKITLVLALMRTAPLDQSTKELIEEKLAELNQVEERVDYKVLDLALAENLIRPGQAACR